MTSRELNWLSDRWDAENEGVVDYYAFSWWLRAGAEADKVCDFVLAWIEML